MIEEPAKAALRHARRAERPRRKVCPMCFEGHHPLGENHETQLIIDLCKYHHSLIHDQMLDAGVDLRFEQNPVRRQAMMLKAEAVFFRDFAESKDRQADATMPNALPRISVNWPRRVLGSGPAPGLLRTWSGRHCVQVVPGRE